jgi:hypothetical protein
VHGSTTNTYDFDALADRSGDNLDRLAAALIELGARYRIDGMSDEDSRNLNVPIDGQTLGNAAISTWRTDAGDLDILTEMSVAANHRLSYHDLYDASSTATLHGGPVRIAALDDIIASKRHANRGKDQAVLPNSTDSPAGNDANSTSNTTTATTSADRIRGATHPNPDL